MNPDDNANQPGAPTNPNPTTPNAMPPVTPDEMPQSQGFTPPAGQDTPAAPTNNVTPGVSAPTSPTANPGVTPAVDSTPPVTPSSDASGPYGAGTMQPETTPTMPNLDKPSQPVNKRRTGLILVALIVVALAVVAWLMVQAFSS